MASVDLNSITGVLNDPNLKLEQREVQLALSTARLIRDGELTDCRCQTRNDVKDEIERIHESGGAIWGPPVWDSMGWVVWYFKKKSDKS